MFSSCSHKLHLIILPSGFAIEEELTLFGQHCHTQLRTLTSVPFKFMADAESLLTTLMSMTKEEFHAWLTTSNFEPWDTDTLVKNHKFTLPISLQQVTLDH